jgi:hypothetical protein
MACGVTSAGRDNLEGPTSSDVSASLEALSDA